MFVMDAPVPLMAAQGNADDIPGDEPIVIDVQGSTGVPWFEEVDGADVWRLVNPPHYPDLADQLGPIMVPLVEETKDGIMEWIPAGILRNSIFMYKICPDT
jgi:hypothetical protein